MPNFSERLKELRAEKGEKQSDVAQVVGVSVQSMSSYEMGREPKYEVLCNLAEHFNCTVDYLLGRSDYRNEKEHETMKGDFALIESLAAKYLTSREQEFFLQTCNGYLSSMYNLTIIAPVSPSLRQRYSTLIEATCYASAAVLADAASNIDRIKNMDIERANYYSMTGRTQTLASVGQFYDEIDRMWGVDYKNYKIRPLPKEESEQ